MGVGNGRERPWGIGIGRMARGLGRVRTPWEWYRVAGSICPAHGVSNIRLTIIIFLIYIYYYYYITLRGLPF